jgi:hypothetical protein
MTILTFATARLIILTGVGERKSVRPPEVTLIRLVGGADPVGIVIAVTRAATFTYYSHQTPLEADRNRPQNYRTCMFRD